MTYVIRRAPGIYVATPGSLSSYTNRLELAYVFESERNAKANACGNEQVVPVSQILTPRG